MSYRTKIMAILWSIIIGTTSWGATLVGEITDSPLASVAGADYHIVKPVSMKVEGSHTQSGFEVGFSQMIGFLVAV